MASSPPSLETLVLDRLDASDNDGYKPEHVGYLDFEAFESGHYDVLLPALEARISNVQHSLVSMLLAGIYFGLVMGHWLFATEPWSAVAGWALPVGVVCLYAVITARNQFSRLRRLHEVRALVEALASSSASSSNA